MSERSFLGVVLLGVALSGSACQHAAVREIDTLDTPSELFRAASRSSIGGYHGRALFFCEVFLLRYGSETPRWGAVLYERAYMHYLLKDYQRARSEMENLLSLGRKGFPIKPSFTILAEDVIERIDRRAGVLGKT